MENLYIMTDEILELITPITDLIALLEIIQEEQAQFFEAESDEDTKRTKQRIEDARELKKNYLEILN